MPLTEEQEIFQAMTPVILSEGNLPSYLTAGLEKLIPIAIKVDNDNTFTYLMERYFVSVINEYEKNPENEKSLATSAKLVSNLLHQPDDQSFSELQKFTDKLNSSFPKTYRWISPVFLTLIFIFVSDTLIGLGIILAGLALGMIYLKGPYITLFTIGSLVTTSLGFLGLYGVKHDDIFPDTSYEKLKKIPMYQVYFYLKLIEIEMEDRNEPSSDLSYIQNENFPEDIKSAVKAYEKAMIASVNKKTLNAAFITQGMTAAKTMLQCNTSRHLAAMKEYQSLLRSASPFYWGLVVRYSSYFNVYLNTFLTMLLVVGLAYIALKLNMSSKDLVEFKYYYFLLFGGFYFGRYSLNQNAEANGINYSLYKAYSRLTSLLSEKNEIRT